ncbi:MAG: TolC family protein [Luteolibacter sp.]
MKFHTLFVCGTLLSAALAHARAPEQRTTDTHVGSTRTADVHVGPARLTPSWLSRLRTEAAAAHPASAASRERAKANAAETRSIYLWEDPMVGLSLMPADRMMRRSEGDISLMIEQPLPKPGVYEASRSKAAAMHRYGVQQSRATSLASGSAAARTAIELALADEAISLQALQLEWLREMTENARQRALDPDATSMESLRLQSELTRETEMLHAARRTRASLAQKLNLELGRSVNAPWPELRLPEKSLPVPIASSEIARISAKSPRILAMKAMADAAHEETRMADRERQPGFAITTGTNLYSGGDFRSAEIGVKLNLPWFNDRSYRAKVDAARHQEKAAEADVATMTREIKAEVLTVVAEIANAAAQADAYSGDIHTRSRLASESAQSSWLSGGAPLNELLEARRMLFSVRLDQRRFIAMQLAALEELNLLVPRP